MSHQEVSIRRPKWHPISFTVHHLVNRVQFVMQTMAIVNQLQGSYSTGWAKRSSWARHLVIPVLSEGILGVWTNVWKEEEEEEREASGWNAGEKKGGCCPL